MDIEPATIKPATDSDDNKSNDSTASQPQHLQEMAKSTVVLKEVAAPIDNANADVPISVVSLPEVVAPSQIEVPPVETAPVSLTATTVPSIVSAPGPIIHNQEAIPPNVTVHQGVGISGPHIPQHSAYPGYQGPPRAPFYGHIPPYQQGFQQYPPYGHHMPPYQQNYHAPPPHGYPVPGTESLNPFPQGSVMTPAEEAADKNGS